MYRHRITATTTALMVIAATLVGISPADAARPAQLGSDPGCRLSPSGNGIQHVIYLQFDNVHFTRDNPNVPSDLEQMPYLSQFLTTNGVLDVNHHTPLIAHTGTDILTSLTGVYGDRHGQPVSNSYRYFTPAGTSNPGVTFAYWTDGVFDPTTASPTDPAPTMVGPDGKVAPAPWVPFTRAGCDVGAVAAANTILENVGPDVPKVFGAGSPEALEAAANPSLAATDFVGIGVHCAQGSARCAAGNARPDLLPDEPGGYDGYQGLFGAKYTNPVISPNGPVTTVDRSAPIVDGQGRPGFPGFDGMSAANTLGYVAQMQEAGVPVTIGYISDAHDRHPTGGAYGPGEAGYVAALKSYDDAFAAFFDRLGHDGITASNTMFVVTADENDRFVGGPPTPAGCDGVHTPCTYPVLGEVNANIRGLLATQQQTTTPFQVHADSAPNFYLDGQPAADTPATRAFEHAVARTTAVNPYNGQTQTIGQYFADATEQRLLHMSTADPRRTPTFTTFANPDYFVFAGAAYCTAACVTVNPAFAWNHGDFSPDINVTWLAVAGPGIRNLGVTDGVWSDHTDIRPTILALLGLRDDYRSDGRALWEFVQPSALPVGLRGHRATLDRLGAVYKQLNACVGQFASNTLTAATEGIVSDTPGDVRYHATVAELTALGQARDAVAGQIAALLDDATFGDGHIDERRARELATAAQTVIDRSALATR